MRRKECLEEAEAPRQGAPIDDRTSDTKPILESPRVAGVSALLSGETDASHKLGVPLKDCGAPVGQGRRESGVGKVMPSVVGRLPWEEQSLQVKE